MKVKTYNINTGLTILQDFKKNTTDCFRGDECINIEGVIGYISVINAQLLTKNRSERLTDEIVEFTAFLRDLFEQDERIAKAAIKNWGEEPYVYRLGIELETERYMKKYSDIFSKMSSSQRNHIDMLANYIFGIRAKRSITIVYQDNSIETLDISRSLPHDALDINKQYLHAMLTRFVADNGCGMVFRYKDKNMFHINGFRATDNRLVSIGKEELKFCMENQPDGSVKESPDEIYEIAPIVLPVAKI